MRQHISSVTDAGASGTAFMPAAVRQHWWRLQCRKGQTVRRGVYAGGSVVALVAEKAHYIVAAAMQRDPLVTCVLPRREGIMHNA